MGDREQWQYPRNVANKVLGWRSNGKGLENKDWADPSSKQDADSNLDILSSGTTTLGTTGLAVLGADTPGDAQAEIIFIGSFARTPAADGVTDDVAALVALESTAEEVIRLKNATYFIGTDYTPTKTLRFSSGTKLLIADGVTVDFSTEQPEIHAPKKQHFYFDGTGTGAVTGLETSHAGWFAGDNLSTSNNAHAELQKWADSVSTNGVLCWPRGYFTSDGSAYIECTKGQRIKGQNRLQSKLRFSGTQTRGFRWTVTGGGFLEHLGGDRANNLIAPTTGHFALFEQGRNWGSSFLHTSGLYGGVHALDGFGTVFDLKLYDTRHSGLMVEACNEVQAASVLSAANSSWITLSGVTGTFTNGETITFTGGTGTIFTDGAGNYKAIFTTGVPAISATITGSTSGATGTLDAIINGHQGGGIRLKNRCHACLFSLAEVSGGDYPLLIDSVDATNANRPLANVFQGSLFDSAKVAAAGVFNAVGTKFMGCWFSSFNNVTQDVFLSATHGTELIGCQWTFSWKTCVSATATCKNTQIIGGVMADTNASNTASTPAVKFDGGASGTVRDLVIGVSYGYGPNNPSIGIQIGSGCDVTVDNVDASACPTPIQNNSGGTAKIRNCPGHRTYNAGTTNVSTDANGEANIAHGLAEPPVWANARTGGDTPNEFQIVSMDATNIRVRLRTSSSNADVSGTVGCTWEARAASAV